jgi:predicted glutamine amidotransferase
MCRIAILPVGFKKDEGIEILKNFMADNTDSTGYSFINDWGVIETKKWNLPLFKVLKKHKKEFLSHLNNNNHSYTLVHLRKASVGGILNKINAHPFEIGGESNNPRWSMIHNGYFKGHRLIKLGLEKFIDFQSENDSEVGMNMINLGGFEKFTEQADDVGVFAGLNKDGTLSISKTGYKELCIHRLDDGRALIASELAFDKYKSTHIYQGYYKYDVNGKNLISKEKETKLTSFRGMGWQNQGWAADY